MKKTALFFKTSSKTSAGLKRLMECCRQENFEVSDICTPPDHEKISEALPDGPAIVFIPLLEDDCIGIKLAQDAVSEHPPRVLILYNTNLPSKEFLCLAFREGVDDVITLDTEEKVMNVQLKRARRLLKTRVESVGVSKQLHHEMDAVRHRCEHLERGAMKWEERLLELSSTATRMATGELRLGQSAPRILIVATSKSQAASAADLSDKLGFRPNITNSGKDALQQLKQHPPRIILTDGTLPDMDAAVFAKSARKTLGENPAIIIAWSSNPEAEEVLLAPGACIDDFVLKSATGEGAGFLAAAILGGLR
jgi:PleD family two-component response regulator